MEFKSLNDAFATSFIKSLPQLTRLDLTGNEIKILELVLSYTRNGQNFYMNHTTLADYLVMGQTKTKAKSVGNIIANLKKKGYVSTVTTPNYNGKNGGSSTSITVNEAFLQAQLHAVFNTEMPLTENPPQAAPVLELEENNLHGQNLTAPASTDAETSSSNTETDEDFIAFMHADSDEPRPIPDLPCLAKPDNLIDEPNDERNEELEGLAEVANEIESVDTFRFFLQELLTRRLMTRKKDKLQFIINQQGYDLEKMKGAFEALILRAAA
ncbi:hypothetical protein [Flavobacterium selenitireducens]|uniref:hypothetical protein n=1 Tax=Flavobacterium selenitireducens TaxID=2722704 RepID=UPI00168B7473|nr:hypothetical protein [Flavobacterium selenitireducens]MBD3581319.1 hypothetical protein [Flavobacterium selenitireducens]